MSYRFSKVRPGENEIIEPDDLNQNFKEFVDEINGSLTRENLGRDIVIDPPLFPCGKNF